MKLFIAFALFAVASASVLPPAIVANEDPELQQIIAAIQSPSTDPATAAALEQMLLEILGFIKPEPIQVEPVIVEGNEPISIGPAIVEGNEPISIGPAIVENDVPISIGPALIDFPLPDGGAVTEVQPAPVQPAPVAPAASASLVQIILNVNAASNVAGSPVAVETNPSFIPQPVPTPVHVVEEAAHPDPVIVVENPIVPETPISIGPAIIEGNEPISIGPVIVEGNEPISIGPAIVDNDVPISIGPALIDFPLPDSGAVSEMQPVPVQPAPVAPSASASLVQVILNINASSNVAGAPVAVETNPSLIPVPEPTPVHVVEQAVHPDPVIVVENPIVPLPVITLPDILN